MLLPTRSLFRYLAGTITFLYSLATGQSTNCLLANFKFKITLPKADKEEAFATP